MWQFGKLVEEWCKFDEEAQVFIRIQSNVDPNKCLSAEDSLSHPFFE